MENTTLSSNKKSLSQKSREWNLKNKERHLELKRLSHQRNKERYNAKRKSLSDSPEGIWGHIKSQCKTGNRKAEFLITKEDFVSWYNSQEQKCVYCGIDAFYARNLEKFNRHGTFKRLSIDRMDSAHGYEAGNLALACYVCNAVKQNVLSHEQMLEVGGRFIKPLWHSLSRSFELGITSEIYSRFGDILPAYRSQYYI